jgi:hypothetical protein
MHSVRNTIRVIYTANLIVFDLNILITVSDNNYKTLNYENISELLLPPVFCVTIFRFLNHLQNEVLHTKQ